MVGEQLKMLSYMDYALGVGLRTVDATGAEAADRWACVPSNTQQVSLLRFV